MWQWRREPEIPHFYPGRSLALTRIGQEISWSGKLLDDSAAVDLTLCSSQPGVKLGNESLISTVISPSSLLCDWKIWKGVKNWTHLNQYNRMENWRYFLSCSFSIPPSATIIYTSWTSFFYLGREMLSTEWKWLMKLAIILPPQRVRTGGRIARMISYAGAHCAVWVCMLTWDNKPMGCSSEPML